MKLLRNLILADTILLMVLGFGMIFYPKPLSAVFPAGKPYETMATLRLLGTALGGLAIVVLASSALSLIGDYRRLALWLSFANALVAAMAFIQQQAIWGGTMGWFLFLIPLSLSAALAWGGLRPLKPNEAAAELAALKIPEEIRQALLRQVGEAAAQEERNRLARDLHDSIKQQLFSINVGTATAQERWERDPEGARAVLADVRRSAKEAMVEMQALLHQLRPEALSSVKGFVEALREQCEALGYRSGAQVTVELGEEIPDDRLPPGALEALFRIAQEVLANVARHARASHVRVGLGLQGEAVVLEVADDGQGFSPGAEVSGMGLRNLRERAESLQGTLKIASTPGTGTTVTVGIPLVPPLSTDTSAIEKRIRWAVYDMVGAVCVTGLYVLTTPPHLRNWFGAIMVVSTLGGVALSWAHATLQRIPSATPADISRLRHARNRSQAFLLSVVGCWALHIWSLTLSRGNVGAWGATAILCTALAGIALTRFHHQTRLRSSWPKWTWTSASKYWPIPFIIALTVWLYFVGSERLIVLGPSQLLCAFSIGAVLVYLLTRQPRMEGVAR